MTLHNPDDLPIPSRRQPTPETIAAYKEAADRIGNPNVSARGRLVDPSDFLAMSISAGVAGFTVSKPRPTLRLVGIEDQS